MSPSKSDKRTINIVQCDVFAVVQTLCKRSTGPSFCLMLRVDTSLDCTRICHGHTRKTRSLGETNGKLYYDFGSALASQGHKLITVPCLAVSNTQSDHVMNSKSDVANAVRHCPLASSTQYKASKT